MKALSLATALAMIASTQAFADSTARYSVTFDGTWSAATHPLEFPANAHFSGLVGATHNGNYVIFKQGGTATPGLERLAEMGAHSPLDAEIRAAIEAGKAGALFEGTPIFGPPGRATARFETDERHPLVSVVAMIAPSPDWFAGVANVSLREHGGWAAEKTVTLYAWDAGTDGGVTYKAADADSQPREPIARNGSEHFGMNGERRAVGTVTFTKQ